MRGVYGVGDLFRNLNFLSNRMLRGESSVDRNERCSESHDPSHREEYRESLSLSTRIATIAGALGTLRERSEIS